MELFLIFVVLSVIWYFGAKWCLNGASPGFRAFIIVAVLGVIAISGMRAYAEEEDPSVRAMCAVTNGLIAARTDGFTQEIMTAEGQRHRAVLIMHAGQEKADSAIHLGMIRLKLAYNSKQILWSSIVDFAESCTEY